MTEATNELAAQIQAARSQLEQFEKLLNDAHRDQLIANFGPDWGQQMFDEEYETFAWHLTRDFFVPYQQEGFYPEERLPRATYWLMDLRLQLFLLVNCMFPIQNSVVFGSKAFSLKDPLIHPMTYLKHICLTQATIGQVRILWERLMGLVYYLETGTDVHGKGSARKAFFRAIPAWEGRWDALAEWQSEVDWYDSNFRTPEFHKSSRLRAGLFKDEVLDPNEVMTLLSPVQNGFWPLLNANVRGLQPFPGYRLGMRETSRLRMEAHRLEAEPEDKPETPGT